MGVISWKDVAGRQEWHEWSINNSGMEAYKVDVLSTSDSICLLHLRGLLVQPSSSIHGNIGVLARLFKMLLIYTVAILQDSLLYSPDIKDWSNSVDADHGSSQGLFA